jgi:hypothetical protein
MAVAADEAIAEAIPDPAAPLIVPPIDFGGDAAVQQADRFAHDARVFCVEENVVVIREEDPGVAAKLSLVERSQRLVKDPRQVGRIREDRTDVQSTQQ